MKNPDPCTICENFSAEEGFECEISQNCPVALMKAENEKLKKKVRSLQNKVDDLKSAASWDEDIRRGQVQGMW